MAEGWTLRDSEVVLQTPWLTVERNDYVHGGRELNDYYVVRRAPFVVIIAITKDDRVAMVRQYRPATEKTYLALPAGYVEPGEEPADAASRELREETGATGRNWRLVGRLDPLPGYIDSPAHIFLCDIIGSTLDTSGGTARRVIALPRSAVRDAIARGDITEMQAVSAFLLADAVSQAHAPNGKVSHENT